MELQRCEIRGNTASVSGGGGSVDASSELQVVSSCILNNSVLNLKGAGALDLAGVAALDRSVIGANSRPWITVRRASIVLKESVLLDDAGCTDSVHSVHTLRLQSHKSGMGLQLLDSSVAVAVRSNLGCGIETRHSGLLHSGSNISDQSGRGVAEAGSAEVCMADALCERGDGPVAMPSAIASEAALACPNDPNGTRRSFSPYRAHSLFCLPNVCDRPELCGSNRTLTSTQWYCANDHERQQSRRFIEGEGRFCVQHSSLSSSQLSLSTKVIQGASFGVGFVLSVGYCAYMGSKNPKKFRKMIVSVLSVLLPV